MDKTSLFHRRRILGPDEKTKTYSCSRRRGAAEARARQRARLEAEGGHRSLGDARNDKRLASAGSGRVGKERTQEKQGFFLRFFLLLRGVSERCWRFSFALEGEREKKASELQKKKKNPSSSHLSFFYPRFTSPRLFKRCVRFVWAHDHFSADAFQQSQGGARRG